MFNKVKLFAILLRRFFIELSLEEERKRASQRLSLVYLQIDRKTDNRKSQLSYIFQYNNLNNTKAWVNFKLNLQQKIKIINIYRNVFHPSFSFMTKIFIFVRNEAIGKKQKTVKKYHVISQHKRLKKCFQRPIELTDTFYYFFCQHQPRC